MAMTTLLLAPFLSGLCAILVFGSGFILRAQKEMEINENTKRRTIRWSAAGSVCSGLSFALMVFLLILDSSEVELSVVTKAGLAFAIGVGLSVLLLGGVLLSIYWFEAVTLPERRKRGAEHSQAEKEDS